jgi:hypothetical protein
MVRAAADSTCEKEVLLPYRPNAPRNRPKETVSASACRAALSSSWPHIILLSSQQQQCMLWMCQQLSDHVFSRHCAKHLRQRLLALQLLLSHAAAEQHSWQALWDTPQHQYGALQGGEPCQAVRCRPRVTQALEDHQHGGFRPQHSTKCELLPLLPE